MEQVERGHSETVERHHGALEATHSQIDELHEAIEERLRRAPSSNAAFGTSSRTQLHKYTIHMCKVFFSFASVLLIICSVKYCFF